MSEKFQFQTARVHAVAARNVLADEAMTTLVAEQAPAILTEIVLAPLPPHFSDGLANSNPKRWLETRMKEGAVLALFQIADDHLCGFIFLFESVEDGERIVHIGYLFGETYWGQGLATELLEGLVAHCQAIGGIDLLSAGVEIGNAASARVLEKTGFSLVSDQVENDTVHYSLALS